MIFKKIKPVLVGLSLFSTMSFATPILPEAGAYETGVYRNMFAELGYSKAAIDAKVQAAYEQLFHSTDTTNQAIFIPIGNDMAYIWDVGNNDVRSEGLSYGMMMAVQMGRQNDFNKLWKWAHTFSLNKSGINKGYFAWQLTTNGTVLDKNPAPDGEEYFATALFFASNLWGDGEGLFDYSAHANQILKDMYGNGQTRYNNQGQLEEITLFNHVEKQIVFSPVTSTDKNWTDPSYHLPAFYELWARWADNNNDFWAELAVTSRDFLKTTVNPVNGLSPDYANFDGSPHGEFQPWKVTFQYDAWRTVGNAALDFAWWQQDPWQTQYVNTLQRFFQSKGIHSYASLYELDGMPYQNNADHSTGLVAMNAMASLASDEQRAEEFVRALWQTSVPSGKWRYYDGNLYMFALLALSGHYQIICPDLDCDVAGQPPVENQQPVATPDNVTTTLDAPVFIDVLLNDSDTDGDILHIVNFSQPSNGSVTREGDAFRYVANPTFWGEDSFSYTISDGELTDTARVFVTVKNTTVPPSACFEVNAEQVAVGEVLTFNSGCSTDSNPASLTYEWNFGDNSSATDATVNHRYSTPGTYDVVLTVTNATGANNSITMAIIVMEDNNSVTCSYHINNEWPTGFVATITIENRQATAINGWQVNWAYTNSTISSGWNAAISGDNPYVATQLGWNSVIQPGQSVSFGIQGIKTNANQPAEAIEVNGRLCD